MLSTVPIQVVSGGPKTLQEKICARTLPGANKRKTLMHSVFPGLGTNSYYSAHRPSAIRNLVTSRLSDIAAAGHFGSSRSLLAATLTLLPGGFQLAVALSVNLDLSACKHVLRCHVADRTVQPDLVIAIHILLDQAFCIFH